MSKKIRNTSIRIISLISCVMVLISCLILPAAATDTGVEGVSNRDSLIDLLVDYQYKFYLNGTYKYALESPSIYANSATKAEFYWVADRVKTSGFLVGIRMSKKPSSVSFTPYDGATSKAMNFVNSVGDIYFYSSDYSGNFYGITLSAEFSTAYTGNFELVYAYSKVNDCFDINTVGLFIYDLDQSSSNVITRNTVFSGSVTIPKSYSFSDSGLDYKALEVMINISPDPNELLVADSVSFLISTTGPIHEDTLAGILYDANGSNLKTVLPVTVDNGLGATGPTLGGSYFTYNIYLITIDTSGVDLSDSILRLKFETEVRLAAPSSYTAAYLAINSITAKIPVHSVPWYQRFFYWIKDEFTSLKETISNNSITNDLDDLNDSVSSSMDQMESDQSAVNDTVADMQSNWTAEQVALSDGMQATYTKSHNAMVFLSDLAQRIFDNMGWFGSVYSAVGFMTVIMLLLSKSGIAQKIGHYVNGSSRTGVNGGNK